MQKFEYGIKVYVDVSFSFCLISTKNNYLYIALFMIGDKLLPCQNNMAFSGLRQNVTLNKIIFTTYGTDACVKGDI